MSYPQPDYRLSVNGQDITPKLGGRLIELRLSESRGEEADQLSLTLDDADGRMAIPPKGATIDVQLGWAGQLVDKGSFVVDETEHSGAPDRISIRARSANMGQSLRQRTSRSWHNTTLGTIVQELAQANDLPARIAPALAQLPVQHLDQTNESDLHLLTRLARQHDAVATIKKGQLIFLPINSRTTASGQPLDSIHITRSSGDQHRWHTAERTSYTGVQAHWHDTHSAQTHTVTAGQEGDNTKTLKDTYATEREASAAAQAELQRIDRGAATLSLTLALGRPHLMPQSSVTVQGFKPEIDGQDWLVKTVEHTIADGGYTTRLECERGGGKEGEGD